MANGNGNHVIDIVIEATDSTSGGLKSAQEKILRFDRAVEKMQGRMRQLTNKSFRVTLDAIDKVTPQGTRINSFLRRITGRAYRLTIGLIDRTSNGIRSLEARLGRLTAKAYNVTMNLRGSAARGIRNTLDSALGAATGMTMNMAAGAGIGYGIYDTVQTYKSFEQQMSTVGAIRGLQSTSEEMQALTAKAKEMGAKTVFSASEAGKAFEYMAMAGWDTQQMLGGVEGIMNLAAASGEDLGRVSDIVTDAMTAFGMEAGQAGHFADVLAQAASNSNTNVGMMGETFKYAAPLAGTLGYSIEDVALATGLMASAGIKAEQAGTSLRTIMTRLDDASETLGIDIHDLETGKMRPLRAILGDMRKAFAGMTDAERLANAESIAGKYAMSGFLAMMNASEESLENMTKAVDNADGAAERMSKLRLDNLAGDLTLLDSAWKGFQIDLMSGTGAEGLRSIVQAIRKDVEKIHGYTKNGFGFKEAGKLALDIIGQLKNKFVEMDGVGSLLAGGALAAGLYKIASLAQKATRALQTAGKGPDGAIGGMGSGGGLGGALSTMTINANSVIVNGGSVAGGMGGGSKVLMPDGKPYPGKGGQATNTPPQQQPTPAAGMNTWGKGWGIGGAVVGGVIGYANYRNTQEYNAQMLEEADWNIHEAGKLDEHGQVDEAALAEALDYKVRVQAQNFEREVVAGSEAIGGAIGAGVGAYLGGPAGMAVGEVIGSFAGKTFGQYYLAERPDVMKNELYETGGVDGPAVRKFSEMEPVSVDPETGKVSGGATSVLLDTVSPEELSMYEAVDELTAEQATAAMDALSAHVEENTRVMLSELDGVNEAARKTAVESADAMKNDFIEPTKAANMEAAGAMRDENIKAANDSKSAWDGFASGVASFFASLLSFGGGKEVPHAAGGIFNTPHRGLVAEDGPEAIIPLSAGQRGRAMDILDRVAPMLGMDSDGAGGYSFPTDGIAPAVSVSSGGNGGAPAVTINLGGLSQNITMNGENTANMEAFRNYLTENMEQMADQISGMIGEKVNDIWNNQALTTG